MSTKPSKQQALEALARVRALTSWGGEPPEIATLRQFIESAGADPLDIRLNDSGALDQIVGAGTFHLEQMDANHWWMLLTDANENAVHVHLTARGAIKANFEREHHAARSPKPGDGHD